MKNLISGPFGTVPKNISSHKGAQGYMYGAMVAEKYGNCVVNNGKEDYSNYDRIFTYHGNDWKADNTGLNLFGGVGGFGGIDNTVAFSKFQGEVVSLHFDFPDYAKMVTDRITAAESKGKPVQPQWYDIDLDNLTRMHKEAKTVRYPNKGTATNMVCGDSHSICMYRPGYMINSTPFKTLNGALNEGLETFIDPSAKNVEFYFGNIDIRHHVCRLEGGYETHVNDLCYRYIEQLNQLNAKCYELLPIEHESRKVPGSGFYKKQPFWGSWSERTAAKNLFNSRMKEAGLLIEWTNYLLNDSNELSFDHMEKPRSIHLSRGSYPYWTGEDMIKTEQSDEDSSLESFFS